MDNITSNTDNKAATLQSQPSDSASNRLEAHPTALKVLVVDDAPEIAMLFAVVLKKIGAEVSIVDNGQQAIMLHQQFQEAGTPFSLVILDWSMPIIGGLEVARLIRTKDEQVKIVFITAYHDVLNANNVKEVNGELWAKPIDLHTLSENLHRLLD